MLNELNIKTNTTYIMSSGMILQEYKRFQSAAKKLKSKFACNNGESGDSTFG